MEIILREWNNNVSLRCIAKTAHDTMADQSRYINIISSEAYGGVRTMELPFVMNENANPLGILELRKERQNKLFENGSGELPPRSPQ